MDHNPGCMCNQTTEVLVQKKPPEAGITRPQHKIGDRAGRCPRVPVATGALSNLLLGISCRHPGFFSAEQAAIVQAPSEHQSASAPCYTRCTKNAASSHGCETKGALFAPSQGLADQPVDASADGEANAEGDHEPKRGQPEIRTASGLCDNSYNGKQP